MNIRQLLKALLVVATCLFSAYAGFAWDNTGHSLSAYIAWEQMTPATREAVFKTIMSAPENSDLSVPYNFYSSRSDAAKKLDLFMYAANWSDMIKDRGFPVRYETYNRPKWHYSDIFWTQVDGKAIKLMDFNGDGGDAVPKLYEFEATMRDPNSRKSDKAIALAWFLHVAGDLHNPLHNGSRVTETEPKGDEGGNLFILRKAVPNGVRGLNLHSYWDGLFTANDKRKGAECDTEYISSIGKKLMRKYSLNSFGNLEMGNYKNWNEEGYNFLPKVVYTPNLMRDQMPDKKYSKEAFSTANREIVRAGYRIAATLNNIFGAEAIKTPTAKNKMRSMANTAANK